MEQVRHRDLIDIDDDAAAVAPRSTRFTNACANNSERGGTSIDGLTV